MSVSNNTVKVHPDRGWGFSEQGYIVMGTLLVLATVVVAGWKLLHKKDTAVEVTSLQTMLSNGVALKGRYGYDFSSGASMTGILIKKDLAPSGYTVHGTPSSGTATLTNSYGGQVIIAPVAVNGYNNAFSVTSQSLPESACIDVASAMNSSGTSNTLTINSTDFSDGASSEAIAQACTADSGRTGNNTIVVTHNG
ncbi:type 4 pilus major pilin [Pantoea sp. BS_8]|uniref:type 4 pilus major pilin n=1 Tax=Pantoea sp. BS_8 TaxID=3055781 RepID=UPI0035C162FB